MTPPRGAAMRRAMVKSCVGAAVVAVSILFSCLSASAENRVALVIGNSAYRSVPQLATAATDARAMADFLSAANFQVMLGSDVAQVDMRRAVRDFSAAIAAKGPDTVAVVYYAGYAVQVDGDNFLIPIDARIERETDVAVESLRLTDILNAVSAVPSKARIFIVDAAHSSPFAQFSSLSGRGLAIVDAPPQSIVAFSTAPGTEGANRPFTATLIEAAKAPGRSINEALGLTRVATFEASNGLQCPWETSKLTVGLSLFPGPTPPPAPNNQAKPAEFWKKEIQSRTQLDAFRFVVSQNLADGYQELVRAYSQASYVPAIQSMLARQQELLAWQHATKLNSVSSYEIFLVRYPSSDLAPTARRLLDRMHSSAIPASMPPATPSLPVASPPVASAPANSERQAPDNKAAKKAKNKDEDEPEPHHRKHARHHHQEHDDRAAAPQYQPSGPPIGIGIGGISFGIGH